MNMHIGKKVFLSIALLLAFILVAGGCATTTSPTSSLTSSQTTLKNTTVATATQTAESTEDKTEEKTASAAPTQTILQTATPTLEPTITLAPTPRVPRTYADDPALYPIVTIEMASGDKMVAELYPHIAPNTVLNFISLIEKGFYNGLTFHRIAAGFVIQGGDPTGTGTGGPGYSIDGEFSANGFPNSLSHEQGVLSMARNSNDMNSAGSQFFIMVATKTNLDGNYAAFGKLISGQGVVDKIVGGTISAVMKTVTVYTKGVDYPEPYTNPK